MIPVDGNFIVLFFIGVAFFLLVFFVVFNMGFRYRRKKREHEQLKEKFDEQVMRSQLEIQEQTLQFISREIHDNLGQVASIIKINLNTIKVQDIEQTSEKIKNTKELVKQLITDLKLLSTSLNTDKILQRGLMSALQAEVEKINKLQIFNVRLEQADNTPEIKNNNAIIIFRMCQEILNNSMKHSEAKNIIISSHFKNDTFYLSIEDDGIGFNLAEILANHEKSGNGLVNLQSRAKVINGKVEFISSPGNGSKTLINITL